MTVAGLIIHPQDPPPWQTTVWSGSAPSRIEDKAALIAAVHGRLEDMGQLTEDDGFWLDLCLDEAITNAILHGNEADDTVPVVLRVGFDDGCWMVGIDDRGEGFSAIDVPDQDDEASLELEHGRGIRLMREWLDRLTWWRGGATIELGRRCR